MPDSHFRYLYVCYKFMSPVKQGKESTAASYDSTDVLTTTFGLKMLKDLSHRPRVPCHEPEALSAMKLLEITSILCMGKPCGRFRTRKERLLLAIYSVWLQY